MLAGVCSWNGTFQRQTSVPLKIELILAEVIRRRLLEVEEAEEGVEGVLSLGGRCRHIEVPVVDLQLNEKSPKEEWGLRINEAADGCQIFYTDGSKLKEGVVGGGWFAVDLEERTEGCRGLGNLATV
ncbi:hypothetical protein L211DRAFT_592972 [Terfezia boudieri ATCC MYA-4762]|uniref:Uncharacterized protein n=1 Tax=Terfezia boudieri ATCC MYA-4762 TaxID=1051890 RepID=A0A3N4LDY2_9PEZI|nr:hypothetical protein L211DRAFT_592972 [Terfezia boudieri ATCC MYA-4762]